ncbi:MAG: hypothetical protein K2H65_00190, partial [Bacteroidales bacterium]|nr:hypothetical protein [Bacteroidales bacterium]
VEAFLNGEIKFLDIPAVVWGQVNTAMATGGAKRGDTLEDLLALDAEVRVATRELLDKRK